MQISNLVKIGKISVLLFSIGAIIMSMDAVHNTQAPKVLLLSATVLADTQP